MRKDLKLIYLETTDGKKNEKTKEKSPLEKIKEKLDKIYLQNMYIKKQFQCNF